MSLFARSLRAVLDDVAPEVATPPLDGLSLAELQQVVERARAIPQQGGFQDWPAARQQAWLLGSGAVSRGPSGRMDTSGTAPRAEHLEGPWWAGVQQLRTQRPELFEGLKLAAQPGFGQLRQVTDQVLKRARAQGAGRQRKVLETIQRERDKALAKRDRAAWKELKDLAAEWKLGQKRYRSWKQSGVPPQRILKLARELGAKGAKGLTVARLRSESD